jgi:hypothetical protein
MPIVPMKIKLVIVTINTVHLKRIKKYDSWRCGKKSLRWGGICLISLKKAKMKNKKRISEIIENI